MGNLNIPAILNYGVIGLGFLLALLTFRIITNEQRRQEPRGDILKTCYAFMVFSLLLTGFGVAAQVFGGENKSTVIEAKDRDKMENDIRLGVTSYFNNQDWLAPTPATVMGEAKSIVRKLNTDPNAFDNVEAEIERRKKEDNNWTFANILTSALALVNYLGLDKKTTIKNQIFLDMPLPTVAKHDPPKN